MWEKVIGEFAGRTAWRGNLPLDSNLPDMLIARLDDHNQVEEVAGKTRELLEYHRPRLAHLGDATFMAISELCNNAVEHGASRFPAYAAAAADPNCPANLTIAIADLGIGIPEHLRQAYPEWSDDSAAIAKATYDGVSGTGDSHRGFGYHHIFDEILRASLHAAEMEIYSANGFLRTRFFDGRRTYEPSPPPQYRKGTAVVCRLVSADPGVTMVPSET
jgi:hypothetical protein